MLKISNNKITKVFILSLFVYLSGCQTTEFSSHDREGVAMLENAEEFFLLYRLDHKREHLKKARNFLKQAEDRSSISSSYISLLTVIQAEEAFFTGNRSKGRELTKEIAKLYPYEPRLPFLQSLLVEPGVKNLEERALFLEEGLTRSSENRLLLLELGDINFQEKNFGEAVAYYELALPQYSEELQKRYKSVLDLAIQLSRSGSGHDYSLDELTLLSKESLTVGEGIYLILTNASYLYYYKNPKITKTEELVAHFKNEGYLNSLNVSHNTPLTRALGGYLIGRMLEEATESDIIDNYRDHYEKSPLKDISIKDPYFNEIIFMIEEGYMTLPDGELFYPDELLSGEELLTILSIIEEDKGYLF